MATPIAVNRASIDALAVAEAAAGRVARATPGRVARGVTTDSRAVVPGSAFVALRGERLDGHSFVRGALDAGAALLVVESGRAPDDPRADVVEVDDTLAAWGAIGRRHLRAWRSGDPSARVVAVTGSAGKTTTKEMCAALLRSVGPCLATAGNLNNRIGLPSVALQADAGHRFLVLEMGMSVPGEIAALASIAEPDVGVVVNVGWAHAGGVGGTLEGVAREKGALFDGVRPGGCLVANADDPPVIAAASRVAGRRLVTFGVASTAHVRLAGRRASGDGATVLVERAGRLASFVVPIPGQAAAIDFVAALAAAEAVAGPIPDERVAAAMAALAPIAGRMHVRRAGAVRVVDDAYNANPGSVRAALRALAEMTPGRRVAVLGEMKELGAVAAREHEALGDDVARAGVALLISCGGLADATARRSEALGVEVVLADGAERAAQLAVERVCPGDIVLVKASRSVGAERVVEALIAHEAGR